MRHCRPALSLYETRKLRRNADIVGIYCAKCLNKKFPSQADGTVSKYTVVAHAPFRNINRSFARSSKCRLLNCITYFYLGVWNLVTGTRFANMNGDTVTQALILNFLFTLPSLPRDRTKLLNLLLLVPSQGSTPLYSYVS